MVVNPAHRHSWSSDVDGPSKVLEVAESGLQSKDEHFLVPHTRLVEFASPRAHLVEHSLLVASAHSMEDSLLVALVKSAQGGGRGGGAAPQSRSWTDTGRKAAYSDEDLDWLELLYGAQL